MRCEEGVTEAEGSAGVAVGEAEGEGLRESLAGAEAEARERGGGAEAHAVAAKVRHREKEGVPVSDLVPVAAAEPPGEPLPFVVAEGAPGLPLCVAPAEADSPPVAVAGAEGDGPPLPEAARLRVAATETVVLSVGSADAEAQRLALTEAVLEAVVAPLRLPLPVGGEEGLSREGDAVGEAPPGGDPVARAVPDAVKKALKVDGSDALAVELAVNEVLPVAPGERDVDAEPEREGSEEKEGAFEVVG